MVIKRLQIGVMSIGASFLSFMAITISLRDFGATSLFDSIFSLSSIPMAISGTASSILIYLLPNELINRKKIIQIKIIKTLLIKFLYLIIFSILISLLLHWWININNISILIIYILIGGLGILSTISIAYGQAIGSYLSTGYVPLLTSVGFLIGGYLATLFQNIYIMLFGQILGAFFALIFATPIKEIVINRLNFNFRQEVGFYSICTARTIQLIGTTLPFALFQPIDAFFCTMLPTGSMTVIAYSQRIVVALGTAFGLGMYAMAFKNANEFILKKDIVGLMKYTYRNILLTIIISLIVLIIYVIFGHDIILYIFKNSSIEYSQILLIDKSIYFMILGLGPLILIPFIFRIIQSLKNYYLPAFVGILIPFIYTLLIYLLNDFGVFALSISFGLLWWLILFIVITGFYFIKYKYNSLNGKEN